MSGSVALPVWKCEFQPHAGTGGAGLDQLTVGALFKLNCKGDIEVAWEKDKPVQLTFPQKEGDFTLHILKVEALTGNDAEFLVTAYKPGEHKPEYVRVVQARDEGGTALGFEMAKPEWKVQSVLQPNQPAQPYPPFGPWSMGLPWWLYLAVVMTLVTIGFMILRRVRKYNQRVRMLADLKAHRTALSPLHQYYRDARNLRRRLHNVKREEELRDLSQDLNREFRMYVLRRFLIPTLDWSDGQIMRDFRRRHQKVYLKAGDQLKKTLREFSRMAEQKQILLKDVEQMQRISLETVERIEEAT